MKKLILFAALAAAAAVSCQKADTTIQKQGAEGIPMSLTADFVGTKVSYTPDGNVLKTSWDATETISVLTFESSNLVSVDNFTSTGEAGRAKAEFTGTFTGGASATRVIAIYPALVSGGGKYQTTGYIDKNGNSQPILWNFEIGSPYAQSWNYNFLRQTANNNASHLLNYCIMAGEVNLANIKSNALSVSLQNQMTVLKVTATMPAASKGKTLSRLDIQPYDSDGNLLTYNMGRGSSWEYADIVYGPISAPGGSFNDIEEIYADFEVPESGEVVLYLANPYYRSRSIGDKWGFQAFYMDGTEQSTSEVFMTFPKNVTFERGHVYRMNVSFE